MSIHLLSTGLCALLLCLSTKGFPRQVDDIEFNSDLERSQLLLKESNSQTSFDSKANAQADNGQFEEDPEFMLVAPKDNSRTKHELPAPPKEVSVKKKTETLTGSSLKRARREIVEEGSGIFEEITTTTSVEPTTATTTTTTAPTTATTTTTTAPTTATTTTAPTTATTTTTTAPTTATTATTTTTTAPTTAATTTTTAPTTATTVTTTTIAAATTTTAPITAAALTTTATTTTTTAPTMAPTAATTTTTTAPATTTTAAATITTASTTTTTAPTTTTNAPPTAVATTTTAAATTTTAPSTALTTTTTAPTTTTTATTTTTTVAATTTTATTAPTTATTTTTKAPTTAAATTTTAAATTTTAPTTTTTTTTAPTTTTTTTTTKPTTTTAATNRPRYIIGIRIVLLQIFNPDYSNSQSALYQQQTASIVSWCTPIYSRKYGTRFIRVIVVSLRAVTRYRQDNTEVEIQVEFDQDAPESSPDEEEVAQQLRDEVSTSNPLVVETNSITVVNSPQVMANSRFTTNETFALTLADVNSTSYRSRAALIKKELEPFFQEDYSSDFICLTPKSFSDGTIYPNSILHQSELCFTSNSTLPSALDIYNTMIRAARSGKLTMDIITVDGTAINASNSGDVSSRISLFTTFSLTLLSVLVTRPW